MDRKWLRTGRRSEPAQGPRLPPGGPDPLDELERTDRQLLMKRASVLGPIFQGTAQGEFQVCIMGLARGRRFLNEHVADLEVVSPDLTPLFAKGCLRVLELDDHRDYKRALVRGLRDERTQAALAASDTTVLAALDRYCRHADFSASALSSALADLATEMLVGVFFGQRDQTVFDRFCEHFRLLGPHGFVWNPKEPQRRAFGLLRDDITDLLNRKEAEPCLLTALDDIDALDETMVGNLIYMVEIGRFDLRNLLRWLIRYASGAPDWIDRVRGADGAAVAEAFVLEVLRTDQSERLERIALKDISFEGYDIPKGTNIRLCLWEAHHEPPFEQPHAFDPSRFLTDNYGSDTFAPFGLDRHQCPFGGVTIQLGKTFVDALARGFVAERIVDGPPVRGAYHWEPARSLAVRLARRDS